MEWIEIQKYEWTLETGYSGGPELLPGHYLVTDGKNFGVFRHGKTKGQGFRSLFFPGTWKNGKVGNHNWTHYFPMKIEAPSNAKG